MVIASSIRPLIAQSILVIYNDSGGELETRLDILEQLKSTGQRVEIHPGYCRSACTLYLGLDTTCTFHNVRFGFHGPSSNTLGVGLLPTEFERWSLIMASYYPASIREWFMTTGRNITNGYFEVTGTEMILYGVPEC